MKNFEKKNFILVNIKLLTNNEIPCLDTILNHNNCEIILEEDNFDYTIFYLKFSNIENECFIEYTLDNILKDYNIKYSIQVYESSKEYPRTIRINNKKNKILTKSQTKFLSL